MKNHFLFVLILLVLYGCSADPFVIPGDGGTFSMVVNEKKEVKINNKPVTFFLKSIYDSRCPVGMECIWAGEAFASIDIISGTETKSVQLCSGAKCANNISQRDTVLIDKSKYEFHLQKIVPYPGEKSTLPKTAIISVKEL